MTDQTLPSLPHGWCWVTLDELLAFLRNGISKRPDGEAGNGTPILRISAVRPGVLDVDDIRFLTGDNAQYDGYALEPDDILFTRYNGTRELVGVAAVVASVPGRLLHPDKLIRAKVFKEAVSPRYASFAVNVGHSRKFVETRIRTTAGQAGVSGGDIRAIPVPLAPRNEQDRIVGEIEKHLTRIDAGVAALERARANLKRYRASVLKAAVEGRLVSTEAALARREGRDYEPADKLLARILKERRARWEADQLAKMKSNGKPPNDDRWKAKYREPEPPDTSELSELPDGWCWASLLALAELKGGITKGQKRPAGVLLREVPYLRVANVQRGYLDLDEVKTIEATDAEIEELRLNAGDVLFNEGGDRDKLGRGWVWNGELPVCIHQNHVFRARLYNHYMSPRLVSWWGNTFGQRYFVEHGKQTTNLASINLTKLGAFPVAVAPAAEQRRMVAEIERRLSFVEELERSIATCLRRCTGLRRAVLRHAFEGNLVPQDPNDEPASELLRRLGAQAPSPVQRGRRRRGGRQVNEEEVSS